MKKIAIVILVLGIALSYSCKKEEEKKVATTINGTLIVNGTNDPIKISKELRKPQVLLYHRHGGAFMGGPQWDEVARTTANENAQFSFQLDLLAGEEYFLVYTDCDPDLYTDNINLYNITYFPVSAGQSNNIKLYVLAYSWVRHHIINTNPNPNNIDNFVISEWGVSFNGATDTIMPWIHKTWSGTNQYGLPQGNNNYHPHEVYGKLTRNGVTRDTSIIYTVPPYDTSVVEIRY